MALHEMVSVIDYEDMFRICGRYLVGRELSVYDGSKRLGVMTVPAKPQRVLSGEGALVSGAYLSLPAPALFFSQPCAVRSVSLYDSGKKNW